MNLCFKIEQEISKYQNLNCIKSLKKKCNELYSQIEESINENLSKLILTSSTSTITNTTSTTIMTNHSNVIINNKNSNVFNNNINTVSLFDETLFAKMFIAYYQLDKISHFFDKLNTNLIQSINLHLHQTILYVLIMNKINQSQSEKEINLYMDDLKKKDIHELFKLIDSNDYKRALTDLCFNLWSIMRNFYRICIWISNRFLNSAGKIYFHLFLLMFLMHLKFRTARLKKNPKSAQNFFKRFSKDIRKSQPSTKFHKIYYRVVYKPF
jgi:hypothetical protein